MPSGLESSVEYLRDEHCCSRLTHRAERRSNGLVHHSMSRSPTSEMGSITDIPTVRAVSAFNGGFNRSTQHLLILLEEEVCDGGDCTDMVHAAAEG